MLQMHAQKCNPLGLVVHKVAERNHAGFLCEPDGIQDSHVQVKVHVKWLALTNGLGNILHCVRHAGERLDLVVAESSPLPLRSSSSDSSSRIHIGISRLVQTVKHNGLGLLGLAEVLLGTERIP